jgi:hypothetical protein
MSALSVLHPPTSDERPAPTDAVNSDRAPPGYREAYRSPSLLEREEENGGLLCGQSRLLTLCSTSFG